MTHVDCERLAAEAAVLEQVYELGDLPRLRDLLAEPQGTLRATFAFAKSPSGHPAATVQVSATPHLICQRCMQGFAQPIEGGSEVEFTADDAPQDADSEREFFKMDHGQVSLRDLAEEELLLALPLAPACDTPQTCGKAPGYATGDETRDVAGDLRRPFGALQDLLKKT